jgi:hypothetical protein
MSCHVCRVHAWLVVFNDADVRAEYIENTHICKDYTRMYCVTMYVCLRHVDAVHDSKCLLKHTILRKTPKSRSSA